MSDNSFNFDDSFDELLTQTELSQTIAKNEDIFTKLFSNDFEDESILTELSTNESLPQIVLNFDNYLNGRDNGTNDLYFDYILGLNNLMQKFCQIEDQIIELWICSPKQTENCIFTTIFKILPNCYSRLCSPKVIDLSKFVPNLKMGFYESIAFNICQLMVTLSKPHFQSVEPLLTKQLLSEQSVCSLLASDVLCFTARLSKTPFCYHLCSLLMTISFHINDSKLVNITSLIDRLIPFLKDVELEFLLKDFDLLTHSRIWRIPNIFRVLSAQQIRENWDKFKTLMNSGQPLNKYNINVLKYLFMTKELDESERKFCFKLFRRRFLTLTDPNLYSDFIDLLTVLIPNQLSDSFIASIFEKLTEIFDSTKLNDRTALDLAFIEKVLKFFTRLTISEFSDQMEEPMIRMISSYVLFVYKNNDNFYAKYLILNALKDISLKSKLISIVNNCCKDQEFKEEFVKYLQKIKKSQVMDETQKINYLQTIESNLINQSDFKVNEVVLKNHINTEVLAEVHNGLTHKEVSDDIDQWIEGIKQNLLKLKKNQSLIGSNQKRRLCCASNELNDFNKRLKESH